MSVKVCLSATCDGNVIDLGEYRDKEARYATSQLKEEALDGFGNCVVEVYDESDELVSMIEYVQDGEHVRRAILAEVDLPGKSGLTLVRG